MVLAGAGLGRGECGGGDARRGCWVVTATALGERATLLETQEPDAHEGGGIEGQDTWLLSPVAGSGSLQELRIRETALDGGGS